MHVCVSDEFVKCVSLPVCTVVSVCMDVCTLLPTHVPMHVYVHLHIRVQVISRNSSVSNAVNIIFRLNLSVMSYSFNYFQSKTVISFNRNNYSVASGVIF